MDNISFEQFIKTYNFRYINDTVSHNKEIGNDTCIIRIYLPTDDFYRDNWFDFGIYDFGSKESTWEMCKQILSKEILNSYVSCVQYNPEYDCEVTIYLTKNKIMED